MSSPDSVSIIIAALNDAPFLEGTVREVTAAARRHFSDYEIIIVNDGSTDDTGEVAERICRTDTRITVVHHDRPRCLGGVYKRGLALANMEYVVLVGGKNDVTAEEIGRSWSRKGQADMIVPYMLNASDRPWNRRLISWLFTGMVNRLFGLQLRYYNHYVLHRRALVKSVRLRTNSYAYQAEVLVKLIKRGHSYIEVGHTDDMENDVMTKAFSPGNVFGVLAFFFWTLCNVHGKRRGDGGDE